MQGGTKKRGRPPTYDREAAIKALINLFWAKGFSATSLDEVSAATGMGRPSLYQAFGNKEDMYQLALTSFVGDVSQRAMKALSENADIADALLQFYLRIIELYFEEAEGMGCMVFCTTVGEANNQPALRDMLKAVIEQINAALIARLEAAVQAGQVSAETDINALATLAQGLLQHLAIRARAGEKKTKLKKIAQASVKTLLSGWATSLNAS